MDKILSSNTIKNVFAALGAKTSDSNYAVALLDKTTAEPKGIMDMINLASVLGVLSSKYSERISSGDLETILFETNGVFHYNATDSANITKRPSGGNAGRILSFWFTTNGFLICLNSQGLWVKLYWDLWYDWVKIVPVS